jgi:hypothetical protein
MTRQGIADLLTDSQWYRLLMPAEELAFDSFSRVGQWEGISISLLKTYPEPYYTFRKRE